MTVLSAVQDAALYLGLERPEQVYSATDRDALELGQIAREAAAMIADEHDWQTLKRLETITGDGATTAFDLPSDYLRQPKDTQLWSSRLETPLTHVLSHDEWLQLEVQAAEVILNVWTILGGQVQFRPAPETSETVKYYYQSRLLANDGAANIETFTADTDTFRLDERLLKSAIIWMWKSQKGLAYAEDLQRFEDVLSRRIAEDKGAKMLAMGRQRAIRDARVAYPRSVTP